MDDFKNPNVSRELGLWVVTTNAKTGVVHRTRLGRFHALEKRAEADGVSFAEALADHVEWIRLGVFADDYGRAACSKLTSEEKCELAVDYSAVVVDADGVELSVAEAVDRILETKKSSE